MSIPEIRLIAERYDKIKVRYYDINGKKIQKTFDGFLSRLFQHELDHLEGKYFVDYLSPSKRMLIHKRLLEISKNGRPSSEIIL